MIINYYMLAQFHETSHSTATCVYVIEDLGTPIRLQPDWLLKLSLNQIKMMQVGAFCISSSFDLADALAVAGLPVTPRQS